MEGQSTGTCCSAWGMKTHSLVKKHSPSQILEVIYILVQNIGDRNFKYLMKDKKLALGFTFKTEIVPQDIQGNLEQNLKKKKKISQFVAVILLVVQIPIKMT